MSPAGRSSIGACSPGTKIGRVKGCSPVADRGAVGMGPGVGAYPRSSRYHPSPYRVSSFRNVNLGTLKSVEDPST